MNPVNKNFMKELGMCLLFSVGTTLSVDAQDIRKDKLVWIVTSTTNLKTSDQFTYQCVFKTNRANKVQWIQKRGQKTTEFSGTALEGEWNDILTNGSVTYNISQDGIGGTVTFARTGGGLPVITIDFSQGSEHGIRQQFLVAQVQLDN